MNPLLKAIQSVSGIFAPPKIISPLPASDSPGGYNDPTQAGLNYYYQTNYAGQQAGTDPNANTNKTLQYPSWLANNQAPQKQVLAANDQMSPIKQALNIIEPGKGQAYAEEYPEGATDYEKQASKVFDKYGVPPAIGLGMYAMEGRGKTINPNNPYNIGAYDTNPQNANAYKFKNPMDGTDEAAKFLAGKSQFQDSRVQQIFQSALAQYKKDHNQVAYLQKIAPTYSSNPQYVQTIMQTPEYQRWSYNN